MIPLCEPSVNFGNTKKYINDCIETNWVSSAGSYVRDFEAMLAAYLDAKHVVAVGSGTAALHLSLLVGGVLPNEEVIVPTFSFVATANAVRYVGAYPTFIDCGFIHIDLEKLEKFLKYRCVFSNGDLINKETQRVISAIIPVHLLGHPIPCMEEIRDLADKYNLLLVEDAAQALGSSPICKYGDVACLSFNGNKIITCGGGGAIVTNNDGFAHTVRHLSTQARCSNEEYLHSDVGYNYRLSNLHAALGCAQMENIGYFLEKKRSIAAKYIEMLPRKHINVICAHPAVSSNYWITTVVVNSSEAKLELYRCLRDFDILVSHVWLPLDTLPMFRDCYSFGVDSSYQFYSRGLMLPSSISLTEEKQIYICDLINQFFEDRYE